MEVLPEVSLVDSVENDMDSFGGDLVDVSKHFSAAVAYGDMVGVVVEESDFVQNFRDHALDAPVEGRRDWLVWGTEG